jgi:hypothetical protein
MFDALSLFSSAQVVTTNGDSTNTLATKKTPTEGIDVEMAVTAISGTNTPTITGTIYDAEGRVVAVFPAMTAIGAKVLRIGSQSSTLKITYAVSGTNPSFTVTAGLTASGSLNQP